MLISEKVAYLNGLFAGLSVDETTQEGKLFRGILDVLNEMSVAIEDVETDLEDLFESLEDTFDDIDEIYCELDEGVFYTDQYDCCDDDDCDCGCCDDEVEDDDCGCGCGCGCGDHEHEELYEVMCPTCDEEIFLDEDMLKDGSMKCHACGEDLEFDMSGLEEQE